MGDERVVVKPRCSSVDDDCVWKGGLGGVGGGGGGVMTPEVT